MGKAKKKKKTIPQFATMLSGGKIDILETIIRDQYEEFLYIFRCLEEDMDRIKSLGYNHDKEKCLTISVTLNTVNEAQTLYDKLSAISEEKSSNPYELNLENTNNELIIELIRIKLGLES